MDLTMEIDSNTNDSDKSKKICWWCHHPSDFMQDMKDLAPSVNDVGRAVGSFCSYECCYAYMVLWNYSEMMITDMISDYRNITGTSALLNRASDPHVLKYPYGGQMEIEEFRKSFHPFSNLPISESSVTHKHFVDILLEPYKERKVYLDRIMR